MVNNPDTVQRGDLGYPDRLRDIEGFPESLEVWGTIPESKHAVAIVGARAATKASVRFAYQLARELGQRGIVVVSGGALGVDTAAHMGALEGGGDTICILGSGLACPYPENNVDLFGQISQQGAVVSPFALHAPPRAGHFVKRNRVIAALADVVVVVSAGARSGSLHTARFANQYGRAVGAVSGSPGCQALLSQGAFLVQRTTDVTNALDGILSYPVIKNPTNGSNTEKVLQVLQDTPSGIEQITQESGLPHRAVTQALTHLELEGLVLRVPGHRFVRAFQRHQEPQEHEAAV